MLETHNRAGGVATLNMLASRSLRVCAWFMLGSCSIGALLCRLALCSCLDCAQVALCLGGSYLVCARFVHGSRTDRARIVFVHGSCTDRVQIVPSERLPFDCKKRRLITKKRRWQLTSLTLARRRFSTFYTFWDIYKHSITNLLTSLPCYTQPCILGKFSGGRLAHYGFALPMLTCKTKQ